MANPYLTINGADLVSMTWEEFNEAFDAIYADIQTNVSGLQSHIAAAIAHTAAQISVSPTTGQSNTNVQAAIAQLAAQLTSIIAGPAPSAAEVQDARTGADAIARASVGILMREIHAQQLKATPTSVTLSPGLQNIIANRRSRLRIKDIKGRTLVNLLGRDGGCESLAPFAITGTAALSTTQVRSGLNSIKFTASSSAAIATKDYTYPLDTTKQYLIGAWVYIESYTSGTISLSLRDVGTSTARYNVSPDTSKVGSWQFIYLKVPTANTLVGTGFRLLFGPNGSGTMVVYFDEVRLYEISSADSTAIDSMTAAQVAAKWPYVDDAKHTNAVYIQNAGKNPLPGTEATSINAAWTIEAPYTATLVRTGTGQTLQFEVPCIAGQQYTLSYVGSLYNNILAIFADGTNSVVAGDAQTKPRTVTAPANAVSLRVTFSHNTNSTQPLSSWQLELGNAATTFEPRRGSYLYLPDAQLRSNVDGSVADSLYTDGEGKPRVTRRWREILLDGGLTWSFGSSFTGYKRVLFSLGGSPVLNNVDGSVVKYNGSILTRNYGVADGFRVGDGTSNNPVYITIPSSDSGWGDSYTPSAAEIAAYFNGWVMFNADAAAGSTPDNPANNRYNGTGTKAWVRRLDGVNRVWVDGTTTLPTTLAGGYTSYRLIYQLAASMDEAVSYEGDLVLHEGGNQIEVGTGVILREAANPFYYNVGDEYVINNTAFPSSLLKNRTRAMLAIYRNANRDANWDYPAGLPYGLVQARAKRAAYDSSFAYAVTYLALDTYAIGIAPQIVTAEYASNQKEALDDVNRVVTDLKRDVSVLQAQKAAKQQMQPITPTLLNGWLSNGTTAYWKDDQGYVHLSLRIKSGLTAIPAMKLPVGYRPAALVDQANSALSGSTYVAGVTEVTVDGSVVIYNSSTTDVFVGEIIFRAAI